MTSPVQHLNSTDNDIQRASSAYMGRIRFAHALALVAVLLIAAGLRFHLLGAQSLWHDEGNAYVQSTRSFAAIAENAGRDIHPPGYYWLLSIWRGLPGDSEFGLRSLSAFASLLSVAFTYALGRRLFGRWAGLLAAVFVSVNTFSIYYAQEARMYALLALFGVASMWALAALIHRFHHVGTRLVASNHPFQQSANAPVRTWHAMSLHPHPTSSSDAMSLHPHPTSSSDAMSLQLHSIPLRIVIALGLFNAAGLYTHYAFPFVMLAQGVLFLLWYGALIWHELRQKPLNLHAALRPLIYYVGANVLALLIFSPWLPTAWDQVTTWPNTGETIPAVEALSTILAYFGFGITVGTGTTIPVIFFLLFGLLHLRDDDETISDDARRWRWWTAMLPVVWVGVTVGLFLAFELFREANLKFLLPAQIAFALWMALGVRVLWTLKVRRDVTWMKLIPKAAAALAVFMTVGQMLGGLDALYNSTDYQRDDYRGIVAAITADPRAGDAVILNAPNQQEVFDYYYSGAAPVYGIPRGLGGDDAATLEETQQIIADHERIYAVLWATDERDPNGIVESTLDADAFEVSSDWYGDVRLVRYATPVEFDDVQASDAQFGESIHLEAYALSAEQVSPGDVLQIQLQWSADATLPMNYKVFVQLLSPDGLPVTQRDAEPGGGLYPTSTWQPGEIIVDNHALIVPNDLPLSHYLLIVGLYNPNNPDERLPLVGSDENYLSLGQIAIE